MPHNAVLFHHPDAVETSREQLMGRHAAGEGFFNGFVRHSGVDTFYCQSMKKEHFKDFRARLAALDDKSRLSYFIPLGEMENAREAPVLQLPGPNIAPFAWRRRGGDTRAYSLCGMNHTIASDTVMNGVADLMTAPLQPWDALICTSTAVKATLLRLLDSWGDYMVSRTGGRISPEFQMPVIPLGINCDLYKHTNQTDAQRHSIRSGLGIGDDDIAVLFFGRLSFHSKVHPMSAFLALEEAAQRTSKKIFLIQAGWFANMEIEKEYRDGMKAYCPSIVPVFLDGREQEVRYSVWCAADIFTSLSDNIQESFGLTPIEAMAAGLPVVVSDWDGYRDTVRHGVDGFTIPTWLPIEGSGTDLALAPEHEFVPEGRDGAFNSYCGIVSQCTAIDVAAAAEAFVALIDDPELRKRMGDAGRRRALSNYDWKVIIPTYQEMWSELSNIRHHGTEIAPLPENQPAIPLKDDPFRLFASYPTSVIGVDTKVAFVRRTPSGESTTPAASFSSVKAQLMNAFALPYMLDEEEMTGLLEALDAQGALSVLELAELIAENKRYKLPRSLTWLAKMGIVKLTDKAREKDRERYKVKESREEKNETETLIDLGIAARRRGALEAAADYFRKALNRSPDNAEANNQLGEVLANASRLEQAIHYFERSIRARPDYLQARHNLGKALFLSGDQAKGLAAMREALDVAPKDPETNYLIGAAYRRSGSANHAISYLNACLDVEEHHIEALCHMALAQKSRGRNEQALEYFETVLGIAPANVFARAGKLSLEIEQQGRENLSQNKSAKRIALHMNARFHYPQLLPVFEALSKEHWPLLSGDGRELAEFDPRVLIICDSHASIMHKALPGTKIINLGHGISERSLSGPADSAADFTCVSSPFMADRIHATSFIPDNKIWITGYVGCDQLFQGKIGNLPYEKTDERPTVLYAPGHHPFASSARILGEGLVDYIRGERDDIRIVIKPHPKIIDSRPGWMNAWAKLADENPHVHLVREPEVEVAPILMAADLLISDASDMIFQYLALDRPIVLVNNPDRFKAPAAYGEGALDWIFRDIATEVDDVKQLAQVVDQNLKNPALNAANRAHRRDDIFGDLTDGLALERIVERINLL